MAQRKASFFKALFLIKKGVKEEGEIAKDAPQHADESSTHAPTPAGVPVPPTRMPTAAPDSLGEETANDEIKEDDTCTLTAEEMEKTRPTGGGGVLGGEESSSSLVLKVNLSALGSSSSDSQPLVAATSRSVENASVVTNPPSTVRGRGTAERGGSGASTHRSIPGGVSTPNHEGGGSTPHKGQQMWKSEGAPDAWVASPPVTSSRSIALTSMASPGRNVTNPPSTHRSTALTSMASRSSGKGRSSNQNSQSFSPRSHADGRGGSISQEDSQDRLAASEHSRVISSRSHDKLLKGIPRAPGKKSTSATDKSSPRERGPHGGKTHRRNVPRTHFTELRELLAEAKMWLDTDVDSELKTAAVEGLNQEGRVFLMELTHQSEELPLRAASLPALANAKKMFTRLKQEHGSMEKARAVHGSRMEDLEEEVRAIEEQKSNLKASIKDLQAQNRLNEQKIDGGAGCQGRELGKCEKEVAVLTEKAIYLKNMILQASSKIRKQVAREKQVTEELAKCAAQAKQYEQEESNNIPDNQTNRRDNKSAVSTTPADIEEEEEEEPPFHAIRSRIKALERIRADEKHNFRIKCKAIEEKNAPLIEQMSRLEEKIRTLNEQLRRDKHTIQYYIRMERVLSSRTQQNQNQNQSQEEVDEKMGVQECEFEGKEEEERSFSTHEAFLLAAQVERQRRKMFNLRCKREREDQEERKKSEKRSPLRKGADYDRGRRAKRKIQHARARGTSNSPRGRQPAAASGTAAPGTAARNYEKPGGTCTHGLPHADKRSDAAGNSAFLTDVCVAPSPGASPTPPSALGSGGSVSSTRQRKSKIGILPKGERMEVVAHHVVTELMCNIIGAEQKQASREGAEAGEENNAATFIQRRWRDNKEKKIAEEENHAAAIIQNKWRENKENEIAAEENYAASIIQNKWRENKENQIAAEENYAATIIQNKWRENKENQVIAEENCAATTIQKKWRENKENEIIAEENCAATIIQNKWRDKKEKENGDPHLAVASPPDHRES